MLFLLTLYLLFQNTNDHYWHIDAVFLFCLLLVCKHQLLIWMFDTDKSYNCVNMKNKIFKLRYWDSMYISFFPFDFLNENTQAIRMPKTVMHEEKYLWHLALSVLFMKYLSGDRLNESILLNCAIILKNFLNQHELLKDWFFKL